MYTDCDCDCSDEEDEEDEEEVKTPAKKVSRGLYGCLLCVAHLFTSRLAKMVPLGNRLKQCSL